MAVLLNFASPIRVGNSFIKVTVSRWGYARPLHSFRERFGGYRAPDIIQLPLKAKQ